MPIILAQNLIKVGLVFAVFNIFDDPFQRVVVSLLVLIYTLVQNSNDFSCLDQKEFDNRTMRLIFQIIQISEIKINLENEKIDLNKSQDDILEMKKISRINMISSTILRFTASIYLVIAIVQNI